MTVMTSWDLFDNLRAAQDEMLRTHRMHGQRLSPLGIYGHYGRYGPESEAGMSTQAWAPAMDISEREDAYVVTAEMPGVGIDDFEITCEDGLLTIQGERHAEPGAAGDKVHRSERRYGAFRRSMTLPSHVQADAIEASARDGGLQILVPKATEMRPKRIQVRAGKAKAAVTGAAIKNGA
jgi:HSP20 family protein